jgi:hypothetical protein
MAWLAEMWPFVPGQQHLIFKAAGLGVMGLLALNLFSAWRQRMPVQKLVAALFTEVSTQSRVERYLRNALLGWVLLDFLALVLDVQINGMQLMDAQWANKR